MPALKNDPDKIREIFSYLGSEFPSASIGHKYDSNREAETFILHIENVRILVTASREFLEDNDIEGINEKLRLFHLSDIIRKGKGSRIIVTNFGLKFENNNP